MDPRERAEAILARARGRGAYVVTPEDATSPMDAASTLQIPRAVVSAVDRGDPEATMVVPVHPGATPAHPPPEGGRHRAVPQQASPPADEGPAIAQEASTQVLPSPTARTRSPHDEPTPTTPLSWAPPPPKPAPPPQPEELDGLIPTVKQPPQTNRSSLSQRLDG